MPKQILLADDSITIQKVIALTFAGEDYKITAVDNGVDALAKARELMPDIILADVVMPQKNGYEVSAEIKNDPELKNIPVLLLAGTFEPINEDEAKKVEADAYIIKPFESQALIQKVQDLIMRRVAVPAITQPHTTAAPPAEEDFWGTMIKEVEGKASEVKPSSVQPPDAAVSGADVWNRGEPEEAAPVAAKGEEDLWESFAIEEGEVKEEVMEAPIVEEALPADEVTLGFEEEPLKVAAPQETIEEELIFGPEEVAEAEIEEAQEILEEEHIEFVEEPAEVIPGEEVVQPPADEFVFVEEATESYVVPEAPVELQPEIVKGYEQTFEPEALSMETPLSPPSEALPQPISATLSEDQLRAELSKVSREVIEKIVWEVVPDMAEMLIKEEIKRLQKKQ